MRVEIEVPTIEEIVSRGCPVPVAAKGTRWKQSCIGESAKHTGVYAIHHSSVLKYVGKTDSPRMSFAMRLRREFQEGASGGKHIYPKIVALPVPPQIMVSFFSPTDIDQFVRTDGPKLGLFQAIKIFEVVLIQVYQPEFQRHHENRLTTYLANVGISNQKLRALLSSAKGREGL